MTDAIASPIKSITGMQVQIFIHGKHREPLIISEYEFDVMISEYKRKRNDYFPNEPKPEGNQNL